MRSSNLTFPFISALAIALLVGCQQTTYQTSYPDDVNFSGLKTYQWLAPEQQGTANRDLGGVPVVQVITEDVDRELAAKGFTRATAGGNPDFSIRAKSVLEYRQVRQRSDDVIADPGANTPGQQEEVPSPGPYASAGGGPVEQSVGTLVLTITDGRTGKQLWQGTAQGVLKQNASPDARRQRIEKAIKKLLADFPPK